MPPAVMENCPLVAEGTVCACTQVGWAVSRIKTRKRIGLLLQLKDRLMQDCFGKRGFAEIELAALGMKTNGLRNFKTREIGTRYVQIS
jgi:hypothetical protein